MWAVKENVQGVSDKTPCLEVLYDPTREKLVFDRPWLTIHEHVTESPVLHYSLHTGP